MKWELHIKHLHYVLKCNVHLKEKQSCDYLNCEVNQPLFSWNTNFTQMNKLQT